MHHKNIKLLSIFNFLMEFTLYAPIAIIYFSQVAGSYALGASVLGITMLASSTFEVPTGILSDRVGRRQTIILGSWAKVAAVILYAIGLSYWWLVAGAILEGLGRAFYSGNNDAFLHDTLQDAGKTEKYSEYLGKITAYEQLSVSIASILGGIVATVSFTWLLWLSVIPQFIKLIVSYLFIEPAARTRINTNIYSHTWEAIKLFAKNKKLRLLSIADAISFSTGEVTFQFRSAFFVNLWPLWAIGALNTMVHFLAAASYYMSGRIIKRFGHERLLLIRSIVGKISGLIAFGIPSVLSPLITIFPSLLYGAGQVAKNTLMQREFTAHQRATMSSLNSLLSSLGFALMSLTIGMIADFAKPQSALLLFTIIAIPVVPIYWVIFRNGRQ